MANGNGIGAWAKGIAGTIIAALVVTGAVGAVKNAIAQGVAEARILNVEKRQTEQELRMEKTLSSIDISLQAIAKDVNKQAVDDAKFHHKHLNLSN